MSDARWARLRRASRSANAGGRVARDDLGRWVIDRPSDEETGSGVIDGSEPSAGGSRDGDVGARALGRSRAPGIARSICW